MSVKTTVIHIKDVPKDWRNNPDFVYIGRPGKGLSGYFGNPHKTGRCTFCNVEHAKGEAVEAFRSSFERRIKEDSAFKQAVLELRGKTLVCFCKSSQGIPCHGDIYVAFLEA